MSRKKIGMLIYANPDYYPPTINAVHLLSEHFDIVLIGRNQDLPHWVYPLNVAVHRLGNYTSVHEREKMSAKEKLREYKNFIVQASELLKDVSLIYAYDTFAYIAACLCTLSIYHKTPLVYHSHDTFEKVFSLFSLTGWLQRAEIKLIHYATLIVFPEKDRFTSFQKITNVKSAHLIIPNFPRKSFFKKVQNWENKIPNRFANPQILLQGAISTRNSMIDIVDSITLLADHIKIKFIGPISNYDLEQIKTIAHQKNINSRVTYFKPVPYNQLAPHTWEASIGLCLYKNVCLNHQFHATATNKVYEYAACALPIIVSDFPSYREFLGNESWVRFANPDDPQSIADAIKDILSDFENYQKMCLAARQTFEERFNYETVFSPLLTKIKYLVTDCE